MISFILAMSRNNVIGKDNKLPWRLPADLLHFKKLTYGHTVVMGRKTYESIGKPLPGRTNVIVTSDKSYYAPGCAIVKSNNELFEYLDIFDPFGEVFIIGGQQLFESLSYKVDKYYITWIDEEFDGDTFFDGLDYTKWNITSEIQGIKDNKNPYNYFFITFEKNL